MAQSASGPCLLDRMALSVVPSVSSLIGSRIRRTPSEAVHPFSGRRSSGARQSHFLPSLRSSTLRTALRTTRRRGDLRMLPALPQTERMVRSIAESVGAALDAALRLGARASRRRNPALNASGELRRYRTICFATHELMAQELACVTISISRRCSCRVPDGPPHSSPATPPRSALLTMEDAASLQLDADIVMLTACNTRGSERRPALRCALGPRGELHRCGRARRVGVLLGRRRGGDGSVRKESFLRRSPNAAHSGGYATCDDRYSRRAWRAPLREAGLLVPPSCWSETAEPRSYDEALA